nr:zinc finger, CCHC-type [Tanacetum cinerariifolium]
MATAAMKYMALKFAKLAKFEGVDIRRWKKKMHFLLSKISVVYVLTTLITEDGDDATMEQLRKRAKWDNDNYAKYMAEDASIKKFLVSNFANYKMTDSRPVIEQYNELLDFKHILKHLKEELTLFELDSHLHIEESLKVQDNDKPKGNKVVGPLAVNMVEHNNSSRNVAKLVTLKGISKVYYVTYVSEAYFVYDDDITWWVESGATVYVCKDRCWFKTYESLNDGCILHIGKELTALVHGRGCEDLRFSSRKIVLLFNVLHVPNIRKNLVSSSILNNCGYKQVIESNKFVLSEHGNKKYVVTFIDDVLGFCNVYLLHTKDEALDKFKSVGIIHETTAPYTPQQNGISERKNKVLKEMVNSMLSYSGLSQGFWGEAMLTACYLLNKVKGIECIFVGYAEHSKAFRFFVIKPNESVSINSIIKSKMLSLMRIDSHQYLDQVKGPCLIIHQMDVKKTFLNGELDEEVYMNQPLGFIMLGNKNKVDLTKKLLSSRFFIKDMGEADVILGIRIKHESNGIAISLSHYFDCTLVSTPMDTSKKQMPNNSQAVSQLEYSRVIGCLMYDMTCMRPDIVFSMGKLSRYTSNLSTQHWQAIQRVMKYLKKTIDFRLTYTGYPLVLEGYTDVSWISNSEDNSSTSGWVFLLGGGVIFWASKKQTCITGSTIESEFVALAATGKEAKWLRNLILEILLW